MMWDYSDHMNGWGWAFMTVGWLFLWALIVVGIIALVRHLGRDDGDRYSSAGGTAEELLGQRFARGEIDEGEYRHRLDVLRQRVPLSKS